MSADAQAAPVTPNGAPAVVEKPQETPSFKVFAGNLAYGTTDDGLKAFFAPVQDDILSVQVIMRGSRSAGYGFVALASLDAAQKAVDTLNKQELDGRAVIVEIAKPAEQKDKERKERKSRRRFGRRGAKPVPGEVTEAEANGETPKAEAEPSAEAPKPKKKKAPRKKKAAAAPPAEGEAAPAEAPAAPAETTDVPKKAPRGRRFRAPRPPRPAGEDPAGEPSKTTLFVANLGFSVDDVGLEALFTETGVTVVSARIVRRRWGNPRLSRGYGFVDVGSEENQQQAISALDGKEVAGRAIAVKIAVNTPHETEEAKPVDGAASPAPAETPGPVAAA